MIMDAHQSIATREYAEDQLPIGYLPDAAKPLPDISSPSYMFPGSMAALPPKMIGFESTGEEHLGITVKLNEMGDLEIKRIVQGGLIDKQGENENRQRQILLVFCFKVFYMSVILSKKSMVKSSIHLKNYKTNYEMLVVL